MDSEPTLCAPCSGWIRTVMAKRELLASAPARRECPECGLILVADVQRRIGEEAMVT